MNISRRSFLGAVGAGSALAVAPGCVTGICRACRPGKVALQLYSIGDYISKIGIEKALAEVAALGYEGVEFAGYYGKKPSEIKKMLADNGLVAVGTHVGRDVFAPEKLQQTLDFELGYGNRFICCPGGGNLPPGFDWEGGKGKATKESTDFMKALVDDYNRAAEIAAKSGAKIGLHNHDWEFFCRPILGSNVNYWDYFFSHTSELVQMEQDVGWTTHAGFDPCEQYRKYPHRSFTLHAKEDGNGKDFHAVLGSPVGAKGVDWDRLFVATDADNVQWYVVECEEHFDDINAAVRPSIEFLKSKGRV